jgi:hypothetical protein
MKDNPAIGQLTKEEHEFNKRNGMTSGCINVKNFTSRQSRMQVMVSLVPSAAACAGNMLLGNLWQSVFFGFTTTVLLTWWFVLALNHRHNVNNLRLIMLQGMTAAEMVKKMCRLQEENDRMRELLHK